MAKAHPAADAFPMMDKGRFNELVDDIRKNGQREEITLCDGMILDGRNRYAACIEIGIEPKTKNFDGDPWAFVWSLNGQRRDLVQEQRYLIWKFCNEQSESWLAKKRSIAEEANRKRSAAAKEQPRTDTGFAEKAGTKTKCISTSNNKGQQSKAAASKTNPGAVARGDLLASKRPDLAKAVMQGTIKPAEAHRQMRRDEVSVKIKDLPKDKFTVIYADPPWKYGNTFSGGDAEFNSSWTSFAAESHYPTMALSELKALDVISLSAPDSVLWLWATCPLIEDALELARSWGFTYKAQFIWDKIKHNMGHYNSVRHEILLICTKGSCTPENVKLFDSVQSIERTEHSSKPELFRDIINTLYPSAKKIELFRRGTAPDGWSVWGNEANYPI